MQRGPIVPALLAIMAFALTTAAMARAAVAPGVVDALLKESDVAACAKQVQADSPKAFVGATFAFTNVRLANGRDITLASAHRSCLCETPGAKNCLKMALARSGTAYRNVLEAYTTSMHFRNDGTAETSSYLSAAVSRADTFRWNGAHYDPVASQTVANPHDPLVRWFNALTCPALDDLFSQQSPVVKTGSEDLVLKLSGDAERSLSNSNDTPSYLYDPRAGAAFRHFGGDCCHMDTLRFVGKPPMRVTYADLGAARTTSGLKLGASAASVVATLGKPSIVRACGLERYQYTKEREGEPVDLDFTIKNGRVIEIFSTTGG